MPSPQPELSQPQPQPQPQTQPQPQPQHKHACVLCARRKIKCDRTDQCANCTKAKTQCSYDPSAAPRPRKRAAEEDLHARLSRYEHLMRQRNIDFSNDLPDPKMKEHNYQSPFTSMITPVTGPPTCPAESGTSTDVERCLWSSLAAELRFPPTQRLYRKDEHTDPPLHLLMPSPQPELRELHPEPRHIYRLWQIFIERVNPLTKVVHVPTLQQRVLDASWDVKSISKPLTATLFAIYTLAIMATPAEDCQTLFGQTRSILLTRYRTATFRALVEAEFLTIKDFEVLQAFALFLFADPDSDLSSTLSGAAVRIAQKMGLHRDKADSTITVFEKEMRTRLWWQLIGIETRVRATMTPSMGFGQSMCEFGDVRLPLNVNDAELHPEMTEPPAEHTTPTEMVIVLMKYEIFSWCRSSPKTAKIFEVVSQGLPRGSSMKLEDAAIDEIEAAYSERFLCRLDTLIPLHGLTYAMAKLNIARMRFIVHHPRGRGPASDGQVYMTTEESDFLFESAVTWLEMVEIGMRSKFLVTYLTNKFTVDAYIYVISELRQRCSGDRVSLAWRLIESFYNEHPQLTDVAAKNDFFDHVCSLTLEAWEAYQQELLRDGANRESDTTPGFIQRLWDKRESGNEMVTQIPSILDTHAFNNFGLVEDIPIDWEYWNSFLGL